MPVAAATLHLSASKKRNTSEVDTLSRNKKIFLRVLIVILAIAAIGQISAIFIPVVAGQAPNDISIIGTPLWLGFLFMALWTLKLKKKAKGFFIGAFIGFILHFLAGATAGYLKAETKAIDIAVENSNKGLPKMIDEGTQLDSVSINQKMKIYNLNMSLVNLAISEIDISFIYKTFEESIMPASCKNEALKVFFNEGYKINYIYTDKTGQLISKHTVNPAYCK